MTWPAQSSNLNPIKKYWSVFNAMLYANGRQFSNKDELWQSIFETLARIGRGLAKRIVRSVDSDF